MDYRAIFQVSASGMNVEKLRLDTAALNLANMHATTGPDGTPFRPLRVVSEAMTAPNFGAWMDLQARGALGGVQASVVPDMTATPRVVHDPGHPHADAKGDVRYPGVNHTTEMLTVMTALRAYEANVAALAAAKSMATRALDIGGQS
jgi:flagellar basal-body rod protein FlgC